MHLGFWSRAVALLLVVSLAGCDTHAVNPVTGKKIYAGTSASEVSAGEKLNPEMIADYGLYTNPALNAYVTRVGLALAQHAVRKDVKYTFTILDDDWINAFAVPGGYVYITRGALSFVNNEAELAGILAHEIGHVDAFHFRGREPDRHSAMLSVLLRHSGSSAEDLAQADKLAEKAKKGSSYSQKQELEADALGIHYMALAGYDPQGMVTRLRTDHAKELLENEAMKDNPVALDIFALNVSHPATPERAAQAQEAANKAVLAPGAGKIDRDAYLAAIDGMPFGANPRQGRVEGHRLVNDVLGYSFEAPEGFNLWTDRHGAFGVGGKAMLYIEIDQAPAATSMATYVQESVTDEGTVGNVRALQLDEAYRGATGTVDIAPFMMRVAAVRDSGGSRRLFKLTYVTPSRDFRAADAGFVASLKSFRPLEAAGAAAKPAPRLRIVTVAAGDTVQSLAERMAVAEKKLEWFLVLNGLEPGDAVKPGDKVKLVELK